MKQHYLLLSFLLFSSVISSQPYTKIQLADIPICTNTDSLEKALQLQKNDTEKYLPGLLSLERSRELYYSYKFGTFLPVIESIINTSDDYRYSAIYEYLVGVQANVNGENKSGSLLHLNRALAFFEKSNDTTGLISCYNKLLRLNINANQNIDGDLNTAKKYFAKMASYSDPKGKLIDQLLCMTGACLFYSHDLATYSDSTVAVSKRALTLIGNNVNLFFLKLNFTTSLGNMFFYKKDYSKAIYYHSFCIANDKNIESIARYHHFYNLGNDYAVLHDFAKAELYYMESIKINKETGNRFPDFTNQYNNLSIAQYEQGKYKSAWESMDTANTYRSIMRDSIKSRAFLDLQTKYEVEKKEQLNNMLQNDKKQYQLGIAIGLGVLFLIFLLFISQYNKNKIQNQYAQFRDRIFLIISHDLKSPILALEGLSRQASFLIRHGRTADLENVSQKIDRSIIDTTTLLDNLLTWGISQDKNIKHKVENFLLYPIVSEIAALYADIAKSKNTVIDIDIPAGMMITAGKNGISVIIRNLLDNALKHGGAKNIAIRAEIAQGKVRIKVSNDNCVSSAEELAKIRNVLDNFSVKDVHSQSGLGLRLVSYFVKIYKGTLEVSSDAINGTIFTIVMPA